MSADPHVARALRLLRAESEGWLAELKTLGPEAWQRPSNCAPWTIQTLVAHPLASTTTYLDLMREGRRGNLIPYVTREERQRRIDEMAARGPAALLEEFPAHTDRFERETSGMSSDEAVRLATHSHGLRSIRWFVDQRLAEIAFHRWDVAYSLGGSPDLDRATATHLLPMLIEQNLPAVQRDDWPHGSGRFRLAVSGEPNLTWRVVAEPGSASVSRGGDGGVDTTIEAEPAALALLVYGRRRVLELEAQGRATISGNRDLATRFNEIFKGP